MKHVFRLLAVFALLTQLTACKYDYYYRLGAGLHGQDLTYLTKPLHPRDSSVVKATYAGAHVSAGHGYEEVVGGGQQGERNYLGAATLHRSHSWKRGSVSYGAFGYVGQYTLDEGTFAERRVIPDSIYFLGNERYDGYPKIPSVYAGAYRYGGYALRGGYTGRTNLGLRGDWRFLGVEAAYSQEFGQLYELRQRIPDREFFNEPRSGGGLVRRHQGRDFWRVARARGLFSLGLSTEFCFRTRRPAESINVRLLHGRSFGDSQKLNLHLSRLTLAYQTGRQTGFAEVTQTGKFSVVLGYSYRVGR